jgi:hypothetical protein
VANNPGSLVLVPVMRLNDQRELTVTLRVIGNDV